MINSPSECLVSQHDKTLYPGHVFFFIKMQCPSQEFLSCDWRHLFLYPTGQVNGDHKSASSLAVISTNPALSTTQPACLSGGKCEVSFPALASAHSILMCNKEWVLFYWSPNQSDVRGCLNKTPKDYIWFLPWAIISLTKLGTESVSGSFTMKLLTG